MARFTGKQATATSIATLAAERCASFLVPHLSPGISPETPKQHRGGRMSYVVPTPTPVRRHGRRRAVAAIVATGLLAVLPVSQAAAYPQDLRSPDVQDASALAESVPGQDMRSPDARDAGRQAPAVGAASNDSSGVDWRYVAIGGLGLVTIVGVGGATRRRRLRAVRVTATH
jgi:hypothetical protein